jgi:hypothetical protein
VGQSDKLRHQMKAISSYNTATALCSKVNLVVVFNSICGIDASSNAWPSKLPRRPAIEEIESDKEASASCPGH